ncbi:unnamed protein product [Amoebophrya sp. A25]|nr:unnamed protein product [Amoebophrya sp. A25]|eukprot:GSA25T00002504001.1
MSWRREVNEKEEAEKAFLKLAKKLFEIRKIENQPRIETNQQAKVDTKGDLLGQVADLKLDKAFWEQHKDIYSMLTPDLVKRVEDRQKAIEDEAKRKEAEKEVRKAQQRKEESESPFNRNKREDDSATHRKQPDLNFVCRHERPVTDLCFDDSTGFLYSSSKDKAVVRWNVSGDKIFSQTTLCGHEGAVWCISLHKGELISGGADGLLCFWDTNPNAGKPNLGNAGPKEKIQLPARVHAYGGIIKGLRASDSGICLYTDRFGAKNPAHIACLDRNDPSIVLWKVMDFGAKINMLLWGPVGNPKVFVAHDDGCLSIWSGVAGEAGNDDGTPQGKLMKKMQLHEKAIISMNTHKNFLLTASSDMTVKAINSGQKELPVVFHAKANRPLRAVAAWDFPEDRCFAFVYGGGRDPKDVTTSYLLPDEFDFYQSWFGEANSTIMTRHGAAGPLHRLIWVNEISKIFCASEDGEVKMWDAETLQQYRG